MAPENPQRARENPGNSASARYWKANLRLVGVLLSVWCFVSFGLSILGVEALNAVHLGGFPLGFWFSQQGSILVFIALIAIYCVVMDRLDAEFDDGGDR